MISDQRGQQNLVQGGFRNAHSHYSFFKTVIARKFFFGGGDLLVCYGDSAIEFFALGSERNALVGAGKQRATEFFFQIFYSPRYVGLFGIESLRSGGYVAEFCNEIKGFVIFEINVHIFFSI